MPTDISVTINPPNSTSVTIGGALYPHANTHLPNGSDPITGFATYQQLIGVSGLITTVGNAVDLISDQNISGVKNFASRPTVNGVSVLLSGEGSGGSSETGYLTGYVSKTETGVYSLAFYPRNNPSGYVTGVDLSNYATIPYATGLSGYLDSQITILESNTGSFALSNNTGSFLTTGAADSRYVLQSATGNFIIASQTGQFYPTNNPSGYITGVNLSSYATTGYVNDASGYLASLISASSAGVGTLNGLSGSLTIAGAGNNSVSVNGSTITVSGSTGFLVSYQLTGNYIATSQTGQFYPVSNPSGYITGVDLSNYATISFATGISGYQSGLISTLQSATGTLNTRLSSVEGVTGSFVLAANTGSFLTTGAGDNRYALQSSTGNFVTSSQTGQFYAASNPSNYATTSYVTGISGYQSGLITNLQTATGVLNGVTGLFALKTDTGSFITTSQTGVFYSISNPSGYVATGYVTGISGYLQGQITSLQSSTGTLNTRVTSIEGVTGSFTLNSRTGAFLTTGAGDARFYPLSSNPSSYLVAADVSSFASTGYVTGVSGFLQGKIDVLNSATGSLYPRSNPSGYITGVDLSSYALQSSVTAINNQSGQWITGYNKSVTGLSFAGTDTKTLTLYSRDGTTLSADFSDLQGTGGSATNVVYLTGDQNISGVKNFTSRPTVNGSGFVLSGEFIPVAREIYIDAGAMLTGVSGATPTTTSIGSLISYDNYAFDPAVTGFAQFKCSLGDYNGGAIKMKFNWTTSGASGGVVWGAQSTAVGDADSLNFTWQSGASVTDTFITGTGFHQTPSTSAWTPSGSYQVGDSLFFRVYRDVFHASDTLAVNANLLGVSLQYTGASISIW